MAKPISLKPKILVVDDEKDLVNLVRYNLLKEGYEVFCAYDGTSALNLISEVRPDLIVLDLMLPDVSGYDICKQVKEDKFSRDIPIIMLTARSSENDRIYGFESGAEDYVVKPFSPKELVLRVKAMLGRTQKALPNIIEVNGITMYPEEFRVFINKDEITLTHIEYKLLLALARHPNMVKSREKLLDEVWKDEAAEILDRTVDAHMKRLRGKLNEERHAIETVRGVGYKITTKAEPKQTTSATLQEA